MFEPRRVRLEELFASYAEAVLAYAQRRTDATSAQDVVSEVFVVAWRRLDDVPLDDAMPWLLACARRVLANDRRSTQRRSALVDRLAETAGPTTYWPDVEDRSLARALSTLSDSDRELLLLLTWEELTVAQAATVLGCSRHTLAMRLYRARRRLARALSRETEQFVPMPLEVWND
jgi:RNA polymerase sigma-70 factor (ECF subfamily)